MSYSFSLNGFMAHLKFSTIARFALILWIVLAAVIGTMLFATLSDMNTPEDDAGWSVFELGFEHQRLLLAAEKGESLENIRFRGDIYMSRVIILRDAPLLADLRARMQEPNLSQLFRSAQETERRLAALDGEQSRQALLLHLRADAGIVRQLMLHMGKLARTMYLERRQQQTHDVLIHLVALAVMMLTLFALSALLFWTWGKLRQTGRKLELQVARQDAILKLVDIGILGLGPGGDVLYCNPAAQALFGSSAFCRGRRMSAGSDGGELAAHVAGLLQELPPGAPAHVSRKVGVETANGTRRYVISASVAGSELDVPEDASHIVAITDVTAEEEAELRRTEYDQRIGEASRLLAYAAISGGIVHEISQPLAAIRNHAHALKASLAAGRPKTDCDAIAANLDEDAARAIEVVRTVRRMYPHAAGEEEAVCDVHDAIAHSVRLVSLGAAPPPPIRVRTRGGKVLVTGSLPMIGQVVVNLLKNALSASSAAGRAGAEVSVTLGEDSAEVVVTDFGTGVPEEAMHTMFAPFVRSARGGMGLGLAICQRIATNLGGSLSWENSKTAGAVFRFTVPLAREGAPA